MSESKTSPPLLSNTSSIKNETKIVHIKNYDGTVVIVHIFKEELVMRTVERIVDLCNESEKVSPNVTFHLMDGDVKLPPVSFLFDYLESKKGKKVSLHIIIEDIAENED